MLLNNKKFIVTHQFPFSVLVKSTDRNGLLENRNSNITTQLSCIIKAFSDFRLVAQTRKDIEKVNKTLFLVLCRLVAK